MDLTRATAQLSSVLGQSDAKALLAECLAENGLTEVQTPQQLMGVAQSLIKRGGYLEVVGRALKVQALLAGARLER